MCDSRVDHETLARLTTHQKVWSENVQLKQLYTDWYKKIALRLPPQALGPWVELGSGPGIGGQCIPNLHMTDLVEAPWLHGVEDAESLSFEDSSLGAIVMFDVLHHLRRPYRFFQEALRVLKPGGRVVLCEPFSSLASFLVYRYGHEEDLDFRVSPMTEPVAGVTKRPFEGNQAIPTVVFGRDWGRFVEAFPGLVLVEKMFLAGVSYPLTGGFSRRAILPDRLWHSIYRLESRLPQVFFRIAGFRMLVALEKRL